MAVITLSRQLGSGGDEIAVRVCELLHYGYFDKRLIVQTAAEVGLTDQQVIDFSEDRYEVRNFLTRLLRAGPGPLARVTVWQEDEKGERFLTLRELDEAQCVDLVRRSVQAAYDSGNIVIVGRGGQAILRDQPGVLHIRVIAPPEARMQRLREQGVRGVSELKLTLEQQDRATAEYLKRFHGVQWDDMSLYHLILNTSKLTLEAAAQIIVSAVHQMEPQPTG